jgi:hypothetical protein
MDNENSPNVVAVGALPWASERRCRQIDRSCLDDCRTTRHGVKSQRPISMDAYVHAARCGPSVTTYAAPSSGLYSAVRFIVAAGVSSPLSSAAKGHNRPVS